MRYPFNKCSLLRQLFGLFLALVVGLGGVAAQTERNASLKGVPPAVNGKRVALVIGNMGYKFGNALPVLNNALNDADDMAAALRGFGFEVLLKKELPRGKMIEAIEEFLLKAEGAEAALFYFAGHATQEKNRNYLMPIDGNALDSSQVVATGINLGEMILDPLESRANRTNIVLLDSCRTSVSGKTRSANVGLAKLERGEGTVVGYAAAPGKPAADAGGNGRNGLYTQGLLTAFKGEDLTLDGVLYTAAVEVQRLSGGVQRPWEDGDAVVKKRFRFSGKLTVEPGSNAIELQYWQSAEQRKTPAAYEAYLNKYPQGQFADLAKEALSRLKPSAAPIAPVQAPPVAAVTPSPRPSVAPESPAVAFPAWLAAAISPSYTPLSVFRDKLTDGSQGPEMVVIPSGSFSVGAPDSDRESDANERPLHQVTIRSFALGKTEVTQAQWRAVMGSDPARLGFKGCDDCPVEGVSWDDIQEYLAKLKAKTGVSYRLPSEAEWEYACRGGKMGEKYCGGNYLEALAWYGTNSNGKTHPVGQKQANAYGLYDMSGNVYEWVQDCWHDSYAGAPSDGSAWVNSCSGVGRGLRGGSWLDGTWYSRAALRGDNAPGIRISILGFRLARTLP